MTKISSSKHETTEYGYDAISYQPYPLDFIRLKPLRDVIFFCISPPPLKKEQILELGCSDDISLFRFVVIYPQSYTLSIDFFQKKKNYAQQIINQLMGFLAHQVNIIKFFDAKHAVDEIKTNTLNSLIKGEINTKEMTKYLPDKDKLKTIANELVDNALESM